MADDQEKIKDRTLALLAEIELVVHADDQFALQAAVSEETERLQNHSVYVVIVGEFKKGKSTLGNNLLDRANILPTADDIATAFVTTVGWRETDNCLIHIESDGAEPESIIDCPPAELSLYITEAANPDNRRRVRFAQVGIKSDFLRNSVVLVDTPGINGVAVDHTARTFEYMHAANVIIFVTAADAEITAYEVAFLKERICPLRRPILVAITNTDRDDSQTIVDRTIALLKAELAEYPSELLDFFPTSGTTYAAWRETGEPFFAEQSGILTLREAVNNQTAQHGLKMAIDHALDTALNVTAQMLRRYDDRLKILDAITKEAQDAIDAQLTAAELRMQTLTDTNGLRKALQDEYKVAKKTALDLLESEIAAFEHIYTKRLTDDRYLMCGSDVILREAAADLAMLRTKLETDYQQRTEHIKQKAAAKVELLFSDPEEEASGSDTKSQAETPGNPAVEMKARRSDHFRYTYHVARGGMGGGTVGGVVGAAVGGIIGAVFGAGVGAAPGATFGGYIGTFIGVLVGGKDGYTNLQDNDRNRIRAEISQFVQPFVTKTMTKMRTEIAAKYDSEKERTMTAFDAAVKQERANATEAKKNLKESQSLGDPEREAKADSLRIVMRGLENMQREIDALRNGSTSRSAPPEEEPTSPAGRRTTAAAGGVQDVGWA